MIYPLRALACDQMRKVETLNQALPKNSQLQIGQLTGDIPKQERDALFQGTRKPDILLASPDVLHHLLYRVGSRRGYQLWQEFLCHLAQIVVDEQHAYIGAFGGQIAQLFRRIRLALKNTRHPHPAGVSWVFSTATIGNPKELSSVFSGKPASQLHLLDHSGAPVAEKTFLVAKPQKAPNVVCAALIQSALSQGLKGLVFVNSRTTAKSMFSLVAKQMGGFTDKVEIFYGSLKGERRRQIIEQLASGRVQFVISTSCLEAGLDLPNLDVAILRGATSLMSLGQRAGRCGRSAPGLVIFVPDQDNHLDYYYGIQPKRLFDPVEQIFINPNYPSTVARHLPCAAAEGGIDAASVPQFFGEGSDAIAEELLKQKVIHWGHGGKLWAKGYPHREVSLRGNSADSVRLLDVDTGEVFEEMQVSQAHREVHTHAIYLTNTDGERCTWKCLELDLENHVAKMQRFDAGDRETRPSVKLTIERLEMLGQPQTKCACDVERGAIRASRRDTLRGKLQISIPVI